MMPRRFAQDTEVSVGKSRAEIDELLRAWGCDAIRWTDSYATGQVTVEFVWRREEASYHARFSLRLPSEEELRAEAIDGRTRRPSASKYEKARAALGRREHRLLLLWLRAALNVVEEGIIPAEALFLPFLVARNGRTVAETALPRLSTLLEAGTADGLFGLPERAGKGR